MSNRVLLKKSSVSAKAPLSTDLEYGEVALNYQDGKLYFKTAGNNVEHFDSRTIVAQKKQEYTATASQTTFTVTGGYVLTTVQVFANGIALAYSDYTATNGTTVVLTDPRVAGDNIIIWFGGPASGGANGSFTQIDRKSYIATSGQTTFNVTYAGAYVDVYINGSHLNLLDYTATSGTNIVLNSGATVNDEIDLVGYYGTVVSSSVINNGDVLIYNGTTKIWDSLAPSAITTASAAKWSTARTLSYTGDATGSMSVDGSTNVSAALTLATVNSNVGSFGSTTASPIITVNAKGLVTAVSTSTITPAIGSITGLGTNVATALGVNTGTAGAFVVNGDALGTPASGVMTNVTGTAAGLTAGNVTTNANLTGVITSTGNVTAIADAALSIAKTSGLQAAIDLKQNLSSKDAANGYAGLDSSSKINPSQLPALAITDTFVVASQAAQIALTAEVGDVAIRTDLSKSFILQTSPSSTFANWQELLTPTDSVSSVFGRTGVVTAQNGDYTAAQVGAPAGSGNSTGTNTGDQTNISGNAATVTTNANLTGPVTSVGNATSFTSGMTIPAFTLGGTVSGGGNQINNVVIGTTTPLAGAFTTLSATSSVHARGFDVPASGVGAELGYSSPNVFLRGYDRTNSVYKNLTLNDNISIVGGSAGQVSMGALSVTGTTTFGGDVTTTLGKFYVVNTYGYYFGGSGNLTGFTGSNGTGIITLSTYGTTRATFDTSGVAVTGALSATGTLSGGTSGTGFSFSGSAPATSLTLDASGNLGIGTSSPDYKLDVAGVIRSNASNTGTLNLGQTSGGASYVAASIIGTASTLYAPVGRLSFQLPTHGANTDYGLTEQMFIEGTGADSKGAYKISMLPYGGNVGIGTTSPSVKLDIAGAGVATTQLIWSRGNADASFVSSLRTGDSGANAYQSTIGVDYAGYTDFSRIKFYRASTLGEIHFFIGGLSGNGTEKMRINSNGQLLIGDTASYNSSSLLQVGGVSNTRIGIDSPDAQGIYFTKSGVNNGTFRVDTSGHYEWYTKNVSQAMVLTVGGNLGINTATPNGLLTINNNSADGTSDYTKGIVFTNNTNGSGPWTHAGIWTVGSTGYNGNLIFGTDGDATNNTAGITEKMRITSAGNVGIGTTSPVAKLHIGAEVEPNMSSQSLFVQGSKTGYAGIPGLPQNQLLVYDDTASTAGSGGAIGFGANTGSSQRTWIASINSERDSATNDASNYAGSLVFYTRPAQSPPVERVRITSTGNVILGYNIATSASVIKTFATAHAAGNRGGEVRFGLDDGSFAGMVVPNVTSSNPSYNSQHIQFYTHQGAVSAGERMRITADGNVGIGTTSPGAKLDVAGTTIFRGSTRIDGGVSGNVDGNLTINAIGNAVYSNLSFAAAGVTGPSFTSHTDTLFSFAYIYHVSPKSFGGSWAVESDGYNPIVNIPFVTGIRDYWQMEGGTSGSNLVTLKALGSDANISMSIQPKGAGNVGIGTTSIWGRLQVTKSVNNTNTAATNVSDYQNATIILHNQDDAGTGNKAGMFFAFAGSPGLLAGMDGYKVNNSWNTGLRFYTNNQTGGNTGTLYERMHITPAGNVGIAIASPGAKLHIRGDASGESIFMIAGAGSTNSTVKFADVDIGGQGYGGSYLRWQRDGSYGNAFSVFTRTSGNVSAERLRIDFDGNLLVGTTANTASNGQTAKLQVDGGIRTTTGFTSSISLGTIAQYTTITAAVGYNGLWMITNGTNNSALILITLSGGSVGAQLVFCTNSADIVCGTSSEPSGGQYLRLWVSGGVLQIKNVNAYTGPYFMTPLATF